MELLSKALLYTEAEAHWRGTTVTTNCKAPFSILSRHVCSADPNLPATFSFESPPVPPEPIPAFSNASEKRKADTSAGDSGRKEKRARTEDMMDLDSAPSSAPRNVVVTLQTLSMSDGSPIATKPSTPMPSTPAEPTHLPARRSALASEREPSEPSAEKFPVNFLEGHKTEVCIS